MLYRFLSLVFRALFFNRLCCFLWSGIHCPRMLWQTIGALECFVVISEDFPHEKIIILVPLLFPELLRLLKLSGKQDMWAAQTRAFEIIHNCLGMLGMMVGSGDNEEKARLNSANLFQFFV